MKKLVMTRRTTFPVTMVLEMMVPMGMIPMVMTPAAMILNPTMMMMMKKENHLTVSLVKMMPG